MAVLEGFAFSQSSLQDYVDCPRRFQLRYLERCRWPAPETADALEFERRMQQGHAFHRLMRQVYAGLPAEALAAAARTDPDLSRWWANHREAPPQDLPTEIREAEVALSTALDAHRVEARYDLLAGEQGRRWVIVDWKTGQRRSRRDWLLRRLQTRVYPFVLVSAGAALNGGVPIAPGCVEMVYWFAEYPGQPERFAYDADKLAEDRAFLEGLLRDIEARSDDLFPMTENQRLCRYCVYRSLCREDVQAGPLDAWQDEDRVEPGLRDIDLESIIPIPF